MSDIEYLQQAQQLADSSPEAIGCGCVLVRDGEVLAAEYNSQKTDQVAVNHAEIKAITVANRTLGTRALDGVTAYCSCEPCAMCITALSYAKIDRVVYGQAMADLFPDDPQSRLDINEFVEHLNFIPKLERLLV